MIERLHRIVEELGQLPSEEQEELAAQIEAQLVERKRERRVQPGKQSALDLIGAWSDLPWEPMEETLDRIRHESQPTPPIDEL